MAFKCVFKMYFSNPNGLYLSGEYDKSFDSKGIVWKSWKGSFYSLKYIHMAIRPNADIFKKDYVNVNCNRY